jgi:hypothetical protein
MAAPTGSIRAGRAFVEMFADSSKLNAALESARKRVHSFGQFFGKIGLGAAAAGATALTPIVKMFTAAVEEGANVASMASKYGSTAEQISRLKGAFAQGGVGANEFSGAMEGLAAKISSAADSGGFLLDNLQSLGTGRDLMGKGLDEQLDTIAERIKAIPDAYDQMRAANELGMGSMLEVLKKGKAGLDEYRAAAEKNGDVMSAEQVKQAKEVHDEFNRTMLAGKSTLLEVGKALLPTGASFTSIGQSIRDTLSDVRGWIQSHREIIVGVTAAAAALLAGGLAVASFGAAVSVAAPIIGGLALAVKGVVLTFGLLFNPVTWITAAVAAAAAGMAYLWSQTEQGSAVLADLKAVFGDVAEFIKTTWKGITDAISAGEFKLAFEIALKSVEVAWRTFVVKLTTAWIGFKSVFVDGWRDIVTGIQVAFVDMAKFIVGNLADAMKRMVKIYNSNPLLPKKLEIDDRGMKSKEQINAEFDADKNRVLENRSKQQAENNEERRKSIVDAQNLLTIAKRELAVLEQQAKAAAEKEYGGLFNRMAGMAKGAKKGSADGSMPSFSALSEAAKGTFGGGSIQQALGYGDNVGQRQLDAQIGIQKAAERTAAATEKLLDKPPGKFS